MNATHRSTSRNRKKILPLIALFLIAYLGVLLYSFLGPAEVSSREEAPTVEMVYAFDTTDPRKLVGFSDSVFVGKVQGPVGREPLTSTIPGNKGDQPRVQFEVTVEEVVKPGGLARGQSVVINQRGGEHPETGEKVRMVGVTNGLNFPDELLEQDGRYLFSVRHNKAEDRYDLSAQPHGNAPLDAASAEEKERLIAAFERAEKNQIAPLAQPETGQTAAGAASGNDNTKGAE